MWIVKNKNCMNKFDWIVIENKGSHSASKQWKYQFSKADAMAKERTINYHTQSYAWMKYIHIICQVNRVWKKLTAESFFYLFLRIQCYFELFSTILECGWKWYNQSSGQRFLWISQTRQMEICISPCKQQPITPSEYLIIEHVMVKGEK